MDALPKTATGKINRKSVSHFKPDRVLDAPETLDYAAFK